VEVVVDFLPAQGRQVQDSCDHRDQRKEGHDVDDRRRFQEVVVLRAWWLLKTLNCQNVQHHRSDIDQRKKNKQAAEAARRRAQNEDGSETHDHTDRIPNRRHEKVVVHRRQVELYIRGCVIR